MTNEHAKSNAKTEQQFVPVTPGGSYLFHLESRTEEKAWQRLLRDAAHMPYQGIEGFKARGYAVAKLERIP